MFPALSYKLSLCRLRASVERVIVSAQITATEHKQLLRMANVADRSPSITTDLASVASVTR